MEWRSADLEQPPALPPPPLGDPPTMPLSWLQPPLFCERRLWMKNSKQRLTLHPQPGLQLQELVRRWIKGGCYLGPHELVHFLKGGCTPVGRCSHGAWGSRTTVRGLRPISDQDADSLIPMCTIVFSSSVWLSTWGVYYLCRFGGSTPRPIKLGRFSRVGAKYFQRFLQSLAFENNSKKSFYLPNLP